ncbi:MAG TPA: MotA/TolQ/ExbB proton channel family protein [Burkholderiales bacterium]
MAAALLAAAGPVSAQRSRSSSQEDAAAQAAAEAQAKAEAEAREREQTFAEYVRQAEALAEREREIAREREAAARERLQAAERRAQEAVDRRDRAEARGVELDERWEANEDRIAELTALLEQHQGNLGELFGVTRQVAGDAAGVLSESLFTAQLKTPPGQEERSEFARRLASAEALPSIGELRRLWLELLREAKASGEVVRFDADVLTADGSSSEQRDVIRIGTFTAVSDGEFLGFLPSQRKLTELEGTLPSVFTRTAAELQNAPEGDGYVRAVVDPASGALLGLYLERPGLIQRIRNGEVVGYVIIAVGIIGFVAAIFQFAYLLVTGIKVRSQLRELDRPRRDNPLGRVLLAVSPNDGTSTRDPELAELKLSEAVLHEVPKLERCQGFLRLAVAAGPLLGLIGTVIGMIITFKTITASGSSDPKLMAHGIGQAMIATVLGLGVAIPLLFVNAGLAARSRAIVQILTEQSQVLLAATIASAKEAASSAGVTGSRAQATGR